MTTLVIHHIGEMLNTFIYLASSGMWAGIIYIISDVGIIFKAEKCGSNL